MEREAQFTHQRWGYMTIPASGPFVQVHTTGHLGEDKHAGCHVATLPMSYPRDPTTRTEKRSSTYWYRPERVLVQRIIFRYRDPLKAHISDRIQGISEHYEPRKELVQVVVASKIVRHVSQRSAPGRFRDALRVGQ